MSYSNLNPTLADAQVYTASSNLDSSLQFEVTARDERVAQILALDTIGYTVIETAGQFDLCDADDNSLVEHSLQSKSLSEAVTEAFKLIGWTLSEPTELLGGSLGSGFGTEGLDV